MDTIIIGATITAVGTIANAILTGLISRSKQKDRKPTTERRDTYLSIFRVTTVGVCAATIAVLIFQEMSNIAVVARTIATEQRRTLSSFAETPEDVVVPFVADRKVARAILLDGAGPKEYVVLDRTWNIGDVVYVNKSEWVDLLNVENPDSTEQDACLTGLVGKLTVRGFNKRRKSALIEYTPPDSGLGGCTAGVYFFYWVE